MDRPLIIGIATVDAIGSTLERFPAPGGLQLFDDLRFATGGCAVSVSIALARLGLGVDIVARVGADMNGRFLVGELERHGVGTGGVVEDPDRPTSYSFVAVHPSGERSFLHTAGANGRLGVGDVPDRLLEGRPLVCVTGTMVMAGLDGEGAADVLARSRARGAITMLDTVFVEGLDRAEWRRRVLPALPHLDCFVPSLPEARAISGREDPGDAAREFLDAGARRVVVKLGARGSVCFDGDGPPALVPAFGVETVRDATGAGDCWCAGFIAGLFEGRPLADAARLGNAVAALGVTGVGATTAVPSLAEVRTFMARTPTAD